jgi:hypothetical protein
MTSSFHSLFDSFFIQSSQNSTTYPHRTVTWICRNNHSSPITPKYSTEGSGANWFWRNSEKRTQKPHHHTPHTGSMGDEVWLLFIFDQSSRRGEWSASCPGRALPPRMESRYPLDRRLGGLHSWSVHRDYRKKSFVSTGDRTPVVQPVVTTLHWLSYPSSP